MDHKETVAFVMKIFDEEYHGKFINSPDRMKIWAQMLKGFEPTVIKAAAYHLAATRKDWAPDIATMREQCSMMAHGELNLPTGAESWQRIKLKMTSEPGLELTEMEKTALAQTSTIYDLKRSTNEPTDRAHYIKAFDALVSKRHQDRLTLPEVKALVARNSAPELPVHESKELAGQDIDPDSYVSSVMSYQEAKVEFGDEMDQLKKMLGGE
jgi:hypothetical protein